MISVKSTMPLWKWILLIVFGSALFLFLSQTVPVVGSFSNNIWIKALLLLFGAIAPYILTGGNNGFEGSIVTLLIGVTVGIVLYIYKRK